MDAGGLSPITPFDQNGGDLGSQRRVGRVNHKPFLGDLDPLSPPMDADWKNISMEKQKGGEFKLFPRYISKGKQKRKVYKMTLSLSLLSYFSKMKMPYSSFKNIKKKT